MSENLEAQESVQEVEAVIAELEQYRERIINDTLEMAKRVKLPKQKVMDQLEQHPEIAQIDAALADLRSRLAAGYTPSTAG